MTVRSWLLLIAAAFMFAAALAVVGWVEHGNATALALCGVGFYFLGEMP